MAKSAWATAPPVPPQHVEPAEHIHFGLEPWTPASEINPGEDCTACDNGLLNSPGTVCARCLRSDPETDARIACILAEEGLPAPETAKSLRKWQALPVEERFPARRPIFLKDKDLKNDSKRVA